jgi:hypothetical protein
VHVRVDYSSVASYRQRAIAAAQLCSSGSRHLIASKALTHTLLVCALQLHDAAATAGASHSRE